MEATVSTAQTRRRAGALPADATSFLGRKHEIAEVKRLLSLSRLVTLTGPGGVGKTRLALRTANDVRRAFHDNVSFVELEELRDPTLLASTVAEKLGLRDQGDRASTEVLINYLGAAPMLLVVDNCEHLIDECAVLLNALIRSCPELRVIATSRQSLGLLGENTFPVGGFDVPDRQDNNLTPATLTGYDSVRLFAERAAEVAPGFEITQGNAELVAQIVRDLDGMPLAIELTAVRLRSLSLPQIAHRLITHDRMLEGLRGGPRRQRSLKALIDWSYDLCSQQERTVWARASVFSGSFHLDAVEFVTSGGDIAEHEVFNVVDALVDKSIFIREAQGETVRLRLVEAMREYGRQKLTNEGELLEAQRRHRDWYMELATRYAREWIGPDQVAWLERLNAEHANIRVALEFCTHSAEDAVTGLRLVTQLENYWSSRDLHTELRHWTNKLLATAPDATPERVGALRISGWNALYHGDIDLARHFFAETLELTVKLHLPKEKIQLAHAFGMTALITGELDKAQTHMAEALIGYREAGEKSGELSALFGLGLVLGVSGYHNEGTAYLKECIDQCVQLGEQFWRSWSLWALSLTEVMYGSAQAAENISKQALQHQHPLDIQIGKAFSIDIIAWAAEQHGDHARAAQLFGTADSMWHAIGSSPQSYVIFSEQHNRNLEMAQKSLGRTAFSAAYERGQTLSEDDAITFALGFEDSAEPETTPASEEPEAPETPLTPRERQIAGLVAEGLSNKDIATQLVISQRTAEAHVEHILTKLGFSSRTQIATWVTTQGTAES